MSPAKVLCTLVVSLFCISIVASASLPVFAATRDDPGIIAYVQRSTTNIHLISPDGANDRVLWTAPTSSYMPPALDLAWRPDGRELAFTSTHENACSWFDSDIFAIGYNGAGYRRITNSPACAVLPTLPQGAVTVNVTNYMNDSMWVYVAGAPEIVWFPSRSMGTVTFEKVADFGPGVHQPSIGIGGLKRYVSYPPYADVEPGKTLPGGNITASSSSGFQAFGAGKVSWKADGSALAYVLRSNTNIWEISANPAYGATGAALPFNENTAPTLIAWGPTAAKQDKYLYVSDPNILNEGYAGIWLGTRGDASGGERLVSIDSDATWVKDIEWLPDGSGFLFSLFYVGLGYFCNIFKYDFATGDATRLTDFPPDRDYAHGLSISPDGRHVVFERVVDDLDTDSSLWIMNIDGSNLHKLVDDAGRPAWGQAPAPLKPSAYLPMLVR